MDCQRLFARFILRACGAAGITGTRSEIQIGIDKFLIANIQHPVPETIPNYPVILPELHGYKPTLKDHPLVAIYTRKIGKYGDAT